MLLALGGEKGAEGSAKPGPDEHSAANAMEGSCSAEAPVTCALGAWSALAVRHCLMFPDNVL